MGRKTWESMGSKPLKNRYNIVVSRKLLVNKDDYDNGNEDYCIVSSLDAAIDLAKSKGFETAFIIGGSKLYREAITKDIVDVYFEDPIRTGLSEDYEYDAYYTNICDEYPNRYSHNFMDLVYMNKEDKNVRPFIIYKDFYYTFDDDNTSFDFNCNND